MTIGSILLTLALVGCDEAAAPPEQELERVAAISAQPGRIDGADPTRATVQVGGTVQLVALDADDNPVEVTWSSDDEDVAEVSADGLVQAVGVGTATIEAARRGRRATAVITVEEELPPAEVADIQVSPDAADLEPGDTLRLAATVLDADGDILGVPVEWSSDDTDVATVDANGLVTARAGGTATITAAAGGVTGSAEITVTAPPPAAGERAGFYVAPNGSPSGDGSRERPWDLRTALGHPSAVRPGDTIWVRGGTYRGSFQSALRGSASAPIVLRAYPGERATIDGASGSGSTLRIDGEHAVYWGLEVMNSNTDRTRERQTGVYIRSGNNKLIHLVIHDTGLAVYTEASAPNVDIVGCIIYNNGYNTSEGHGHALYIRNLTGSKLLRDNVMFNQFAYGIHVYTTPGGGLNNITVEGNTSFNNGSVSDDSREHAGNLLVGGEEPVQQGKVIDNMTYYAPDVGSRNVSIGYSSTNNRDVVVRGNYAVGGDVVFTVRNWDQVTVQDNVFHGTARIVELVESSLSGYTWSGNTHYRDASASAWRHAGSTFAFAEWRSRTGLGGTDQVAGTAPSQTRVFVRPSSYEPGRAHVTVYNWAGQGSVQVDMTGVLKPGDRYEVRNVQALYGSPIASGTYAGGAITIPLGGVNPTQPIGGSPTPAKKTGPFFDVFLVTKPAG